MSNEELLEGGIRAVREGRLEEARSLLARHVKANPNSEQGWLWLGACLSDPAQREYCFKRVLQLNPDSLIAKQQLGISTRSTSPAPTPPPQSTQPTSRETLPTDEPVDQRAVEIIPEAEQPAPSKLPAAISSSSERTPSRTGKKRRDSRGSLWLILATLIITASIVYLYYSDLLPAWSIPTQPNPSATQPASQASPSIIPLANAASQTPAVSSEALPTVVYTPQFQSAECLFEIPAGADVECGYVIVPEDRTGDASDTIQLAVAVYHSQSQAPEPDPIIFLQGGPGGEALGTASALYNTLVLPFIDRRDFIVFDQRGTGASHPALPCDELEKIYSQDLRGLIPPDTRRLVYANAFRSCRDLLASLGADLSDYTTAANAADVKDVLLTLGYTQGNLYGVSYGTLLGQVVMRDYPEIVRSAVLDSVLPIGTNIYTTHPERMEHALQTLFDACEADATCSSTFPDLEGILWDLVERLDAQSLSVPVIFPQAGRAFVSVDGSMLLIQVLTWLKYSALLPDVPQAIYQIHNGDTSSLSFSIPYPPIEWDFSVSLGMYISVFCHEEIQTQTAQELDSALSQPHDLGEEGLFPFYEDGGSMLDACQIWPTAPLVTGETEPLVSDIPTFLISGSFDPTTPPIFAEALASQLQTSYILEVLDQSHVPSASGLSDCPVEAILSFLGDPQDGPQVSCVSRMVPPDFSTPYNGTPPIPLRSTLLEQEGIRVRTPESWTGYEGGVFARLSSFMDITQLAVFRLPVTPEETLALLSERTFYGRIGFDSALALVGQRTVNGLNWSLYQTTSYGVMVDMALAYSGGETLVVILFSHADEHDAIHDAVFLPAVNSAQAVP